MLNFDYSLFEEVIECESGTAEVQWKNIKECVLDTISDLVGKVEKRARKLWITQEMICKIDERRKWKNVKTEEDRRNYGRLRNELKRATEKTKKEYLEQILMRLRKCKEQDVMILCI